MVALYRYILVFIFIAPAAQASTQLLPKCKDLGKYTLKPRLRETLAIHVLQHPNTLLLGYDCDLEVLAYLFIDSPSPYDIYKHYFGNPIKGFCRNRTSDILTFARAAVDSWKEILQNKIHKKKLFGCNYKKYSRTQKTACVFF
ncbi:unnamed protein product [Strongylus vulgaris]|uniref:SCP domain-containing protein n=1 Tax=Strongylus vulgaris TaxID=40348 RepID=A0A3P7JG01_STRVU|nr:unnamed protein product [Strongylus vulgaris]